MTKIKAHLLLPFISLDDYNKILDFRSRLHDYNEVFIAVDPSGNFEKGKGKTAIVISSSDISVSETFVVDAKKFGTRNQYWHYVSKLICQMVESFKIDIQVHVIIEQFSVRANGFTLGIMPETVMMIGIIEQSIAEYMQGNIIVYDKNNVYYTYQSPSQAKSRFKDEDLPRYLPALKIRITKSGTKTYYLDKKRINDHVRDAIKHLLYYTYFTRKKKGY